MVLSYFPVTRVVRTEGPHPALVVNLFMIWGRKVVFKGGWDYNACRIKNIRQGMFVRVF